MKPDGSTCSQDSGGMNSGHVEVVSQRRLLGLPVAEGDLVVFGVEDAGGFEIATRKT